MFIWLEHDMKSYLCRLLTFMTMAVCCISTDYEDEHDTRYGPKKYTPVPDFLPSPSNVTVHIGDLAILRCSVYNLGIKTVVWRRLESSFPLTSGLVTVVPEERIQISHVTYSNQWDLLIKSVTKEDEGAYECQIASREKSKRKLVYLTVIDPELDTPSITITDDQFIEKGEHIHLQCNATGDYYPPDEMDWFRNGHRLTSNQDDGILITKQYSLSRRTFMSHLHIERARMADTGTYVCRASITQIASTKVNILNGETYNIKRAGNTRNEDYTLDTAEDRRRMKGPITQDHSSAFVHRTNHLCLVMCLVVFVANNSQNRSRFFVSMWTFQ